MTTDKLPAHCPQAEAMLLACCASKPEVLAQLEPGLFYLEHSKEILTALCKLPREAFGEEWKVQAELHRLLPEVAFQRYSEAMKDLPSPAGWQYWLDKAAEYRDERERHALVAEAEAGGDLAVIGRKLTALAGRRTATSVNSMSNLVPTLIDELETAFQSKGALRGLPTGLRRLDKVTRGFEPGRLYVIGGRPGTGKSALLAQMAVAAGAPVVFISLEMPASEVVGRIVQARAGVTLNDFYAGGATKADFEKLQAALPAVRKLPLEVADNVSVLQDIIRAATEAVQQRGARAIFLDYLQRVRAPGFKSRYETVTEISTALKNLAMDLRVPVIAAAQLSRLSEHEKRKPGLADLRDSGSVEQDADVVVLLHPDPKDKTKVSLAVAKNRSGPVGTIDLTFIPELTRFDETQQIASEDVPNRQPYAD